MAISSMHSNAPAQSTNTQVDLDCVFRQLQEQLNQGDAEPIVPFTLVSLLGINGMKELKERLEIAYAVPMTIDIDLFANTVKVLPVMPRISTAINDGARNTTKNHDRKKQEKVPRPPITDAFILYRKDRHSQIVAANPGLHNNRISVILGEKWRSESQVVRDEYKRKAAIAKAEHTFLHPNYSYQPRKPFEKKRRMTKGKLAKLAAVGQSPMPTIDFQDSPGYASFNATSKFRGSLALKLEERKGAYGAGPTDFAIDSLVHTSDDVVVDDAAHIPVESFATAVYNNNGTTWSDMMNIVGFKNTPFFFSNDSTLPGPGYRGGTATTTPDMDDCAEIERQRALQEEMNALFDFDGATTFPP